MIIILEDKATHMLHQFSPCLEKDYLHIKEAS